MKQTGLLIICLSFLTLAIIITIGYSAQFNKWYENIPLFAYFLIFISFIIGLLIALFSKPNQQV
jgi:hypothetical protein